MIAKRNLILLSALFVTLWLTWRSYQQDHVIEISQPTRVLNIAQNDAQQRTGKADQLILKQRDSSASIDNLFSIPPRKVLPQIKISTIKAPPAVAPALPFKYLGRMLVGADNGVMLDVQGEVTPIQQGDVLLGQYKVQAINENSGGLQIKFLYLPLNQMQTLSAQTDN